MHFKSPIFYNIDNHLNLKVGKSDMNREKKQTLNAAPEEEEVEYNLENDIKFNTSDTKVINYLNNQVINQELNDENNGDENNNKQNDSEEADNNSMYEIMKKKEV